MLKELSLANASALIMAVYYIICRLLAGVAPDFLRAVGQSWFHTFTFTESGNSNLGLGPTVFGFVSAVILSWITGYAFAYLYNKLSK